MASNEDFTLLAQGNQMGPIDIDIDIINIIDIDIDIDIDKPTFII